MLALLRRIDHFLMTKVIETGGWELTLGVNKLCSLYQRYECNTITVKMGNYQAKIELIFRTEIKKKPVVIKEVFVCCDFDAIQQLHDCENDINVECTVSMASQVNQNKAKMLSMNVRHKNINITQMNFYGIKDPCETLEKPADLQRWNL